MRRSTSWTSGGKTHKTYKFHGRTIEESLIFGQPLGGHAPEGFESRSSGIGVYEEPNTVHIHSFDACNLLGSHPASGELIETTDVIETTQTRRTFRVLVSFDSEHWTNPSTGGPVNIML